MLSVSVSFLFLKVQAIKFGSSRRSRWVVWVPLPMIFLTPLLNHQCCQCFESSGPLQSSCIQSRKLKKNKKHSSTGEQPEIYILCCLVVILSQTVWQRSALYNIYIKLFGFVQLQPLYSTTAASKWLWWDCSKGTVPPSIICQKY